MYRWLREIHLIAGLCFFPFAMMYGVSAIQMSHRTWFKLESKIAETKAFVAPEKATDGRAVARALLAQGVIWGELANINQTGAGYTFQLHRSGGSFDVKYDRSTGAVLIKNTEIGLNNTLVRIHHYASVNHDYWVADAWGVLLGLTALALIVVAITGTWIWTKLRRERLVGTVLLVLALGYSLTLLIAIRING
jgi:hypothetical protein